MSPVVVIGAGIVGASVAYHLAYRGVPVTLVERAYPAAGVTGASFAWIGEAGGEWPGGAEDLRGSVLADYRRLAAEVPSVAVRWTGSLVWGNDAVAPEEGQHWLGRNEIATLEPHLRALPERAVYTPTDGGVDPGGTTRALVDAARRYGARMALGARATALRVVSGRVVGVESPAGFYPASTVVLAAGTATGALCAPLGVTLPIAAVPSFLLWASSPPGLVKTILACPEFEARESRDGHLLLVAPYDAGDQGMAQEQAAQQTLARVRAAFGDADALLLHGATVGQRPIPAGGPVVGYLAPDQSVYVAVMHSAVTLAPTVGRLVANELVSGMPAAELQRCRPHRFLAP